MGNVKNENTIGKAKEKLLGIMRSVSRTSSTLFLLIFDCLAVMLSFVLALLLQYQFSVSDAFSQALSLYMISIVPYTLLCVTALAVLRLYRSLWRFAGYSEMIRCFAASLISIFVYALAMGYLKWSLPITYYALGFFFQLLFTLGIRLLYRFVSSELERLRTNNSGFTRRAMLIGAGSAGQLILRDIFRSSQVRTKVVCVIDDDKSKWGRYIEGIPIVGGRNDILHCVKKYKVEQILIALPSATAAAKRDIINICKESGCMMLTLPGMYQLVNDQVSVSKMKEVNVEDLLGREVISVDTDEIFQSLCGKVILVTGGGGSIGSELCRQIAAHEPKQLIIFDIYENNAYEIEQELKIKFPELNMAVVIGSVRDSRRIKQVFSVYRPDIVYHAAAHKHVPLMETSPCEAIKNNVMGTYKTALAAMSYGCKRFVLISTDKAVNPTNIMGASKRLCEMVVQSMNAISHQGRYDLLPLLCVHQTQAHLLMCEQMNADFEKGTHTEFVAVRFGNVLGSNGSVIPLFMRQIENGGPVTVTHPDIIRYFMTIKEAVSLVLQAGSYANGGEIFVLDMGEPVKIAELARNLIKLAGYRPDIDIPIVYSGLRPGEKLYEEKLMAEEGLMRTKNRLIHIGKPVDFDFIEFMGQLSELAQAAYDNDPDTCKLVQRMVKTYKPIEE